MLAELKLKATSMPPSKRTIIPPTNGWQENCSYAADISYNPLNPIHRCLFYTGFLDKDGEPNGYNTIFNPSGDSDTCITDLHYLKVYHKLDICFDD